jgi:phage terminase small subunit
MNNRHQQFIDEYLSNGMNGTQAYKKVYPSVQDNTARINANKLLTRTDVAEEVKKRQEVTANRLEITREYIVKEYLELIESAKQVSEDFGPDRTNWNKSLAQLSKLLGLDAAEKKDITFDGTLDITKLFGFEDEDDENQQLND